MLLSIKVLFCHHVVLLHQFIVHILIVRVTTHHVLRTIWLHDLRVLHVLLGPINVGMLSNLGLEELKILLLWLYFTLWVVFVESVCSWLASLLFCWFCLMLELRLMKIEGVKKFAWRKRVLQLWIKLLLLCLQSDWISLVSFLLHILSVVALLEQLLAWRLVCLAGRIEEYFEVGLGSWILCWIVKFHYYS